MLAEKNAQILMQRSGPSLSYALTAEKMLKFFLLYKKSGDLPNVGAALRYTETHALRL